MGNNEKRSTSKGNKNAPLDPHAINHVKNRDKRRKLYRRYLRKKRQAKNQIRKEVDKIIQEKGPDAVPKFPVRTIESARVKEETVVEEIDDDIAAEEAIDEYAETYNKEEDGAPHVMITCSENPQRKMRAFMKELYRVIPNSSVKYRPKASVRELVEGANKRNCTDLVVLGEDHKYIHSMLLIHLPAGPTAYFKLSNVKTCRDLKKKPENIFLEQPEVILNNFTTRLGRSVSRMLGALFHHTPDFEGRRACTFHNQRDFIFFRNHVYEFKSNEKVGIRELGPRFTMKLQWLQEGAFEGDYEFVYKRKEQETSRTKFLL